MNGYLRGFVCHGGTRPRASSEDGADRFDALWKHSRRVIFVCMIRIPRQRLSHGRISCVPRKLHREIVPDGESDAQNKSHALCSVETARCVDAYDPPVAIGGVSGRVAARRCCRATPLPMPRSSCPRHGLACSLPRPQDGRASPPRNIPGRGRSPARPQEVEPAVHIKTCVVYAQGPPPAVRPGRPMLHPRSCH